MLSKQKRVTREMFGLLKNPYISAQNELFYLKTQKSSSLGGRVAFSVSKKVSKSAVVRNRLRRWGYATIKEFLDKLGDLIMVISFRNIPKTKNEVSLSLRSILNKAKIIN